MTFPAEVAYLDSSSSLEGRNFDISAHYITIIRLVCINSSQVKLVEVSMMLIHGARWSRIGRQTALLRRWISCNSCGVELQSKNAETEGFYPKKEAAVHTPKTSLERAKYLLFSQDLQRLKEGQLSDRQAKVEAPPICKRCSDALHQNTYDIEQFPDASYREVIRDVPPQSSILHLASLPEFPLGLNAKLLKNKNFDTTLVLTKADQVIQSKPILQRDVPLFLKDFLKYQMALPMNKVLAVSSIKGWNIDSLYSFLKAKTYLLGEANVGKSSLINTYVKKYLGTKVMKDKRGNVIDRKQYGVQNMKQHLKNNSAGVYHVPNMTRSLQQYDINGKALYDLPGYSDEQKSVALEDIIKRDWLQRIRKTDLFDSRKIKKKHYTSFNGTENGACYTIGGILFLVPPKGTTNQIVKYIPGEHSEFKNVDKALEVFKECSTPESEHPLKKYCGITSSACDKDNFVRHVLPPFQGSIEIVIKDIGYLMVRSTGAYGFKGLYEVWLPKGMEMCIREPLEKTIIANYEQFMESKGKTACCPRNRPIVSSTYKMDHDISDTLTNMKEMYMEKTSHDLSSRRLKDVEPLEILNTKADEPYNLYWYYQW